MDENRLFPVFPITLRCTDAHIPRQNTSLFRRRTASQLPFVFLPFKPESPGSPATNLSDRPARHGGNSAASADFPVTRMKKRHFCSGGTLCHTLPELEKSQNVAFEEGRNMFEFALTQQRRER